MIKIYKNLLFIVLLYPAVFFSQKPIANLNTNGSLVLYNPAFTGRQSCPIVSVNHLFQNQSRNNSFVANYNKNSYRLYGGVGLTVLHDTKDSNNNFLSVSGSYSYLIRVSRKLYVSTAVELSYNRKKVDFSSPLDRYNFAELTNSLIPAASTISDTKYFNMTAGVLAYSEMFYVGFTMENLITPIEATSQTKNFRLPLGYTAISGVYFYFSKKKYQIPNKAIYVTVASRNQKERLIVDSIQQPLISKLRYFQSSANVRLGKLIFGVGVNYDFKGSSTYQCQAGLYFNSIRINYSIASSRLSSTFQKLILFHQTTISYKFICRHSRRPHIQISSPQF